MVVLRTLFIHCYLCFDSIESNKCSVGNLIHLHNDLLTYRGYNYESLRIPIYTRLNVSFWRQQLVCYFDKDVCDFLEFGWPIHPAQPNGRPTSASVLLPTGRKPSGHISFPLGVIRYPYLKLRVSYQSAALSIIQSN